MSLFGAVGEYNRDGKEILTGSGALSASGSLEIETPFQVIDHVDVEVVKAAVPTTKQLTYAVSGSTVTVYGWTATAASDAEETVSFEVIGRRRK